MVEALRRGRTAECAGVNMPEQISLFETGGPLQKQPPTDRLFFAIFPDRAASERIATLAKQLRREHELKGAPLKTDRFHITLHHLGDHPSLRQDIIEQASASARTIAVPKFRIVFDRVMSFSRRSGKRPFVLRGDAGLEELIAFRYSLSLAMQKVGLAEYANTTFTPHLTLLYDEQSVAEQPIDTIEWTACELVLVHSLLGKTEHRHLATWPLLS